MPCTYDDFGASSRAKNQEITDLTRILCTICQKLEDTKNLKLMTPAVRKWWKSHKEADAERKATKQAAKTREDLVKAVLGECTPEERAALKAQGLKVD